MAGKSAPKAALKLKPRILIVEDEFLVRAVVADTARDSGYEVVEAGDADAALEYFSSGRSVDLLFSDIEMPGSMNGVELARYVRMQYSEVKVLLTSGRIGSEVAKSLAPFIPKPYSPTDALAQIAEILKQE